MSDDIARLESDLFDLQQRFSSIEQNIFGTNNSFNNINCGNTITIKNIENDPISDTTKSFDCQEGIVSLTNPETDISNLYQVIFKQGYNMQYPNEYYLNDTGVTSVTNDPSFNIVTDQIKMIFADIINNTNIGGNANVVGMLIVASDINVKKDLNLLENSLEKIKNLNGYKYKRTDLSDNDKIHIGVIAQEVEKDFPELITERIKDNKILKGVNYNGLIPILIESVKELSLKIEVLEKNNKYLENKLKLLDIS